MTSGLKIDLLAQCRCGGGDPDRQLPHTPRLRLGLKTPFSSPPSTRNLHQRGPGNSIANAWGTRLYLRKTSSRTGTTSLGKHLNFTNAQRATVCTVTAPITLFDWCKIRYGGSSTAQPALATVADPDQREVRRPARRPLIRRRPLQPSPGALERSRGALSRCLGIERRRSRRVSP